MNDQRAKPAPVLDIAIPVYNEERVLEQSVRALHAHVRARIPFSTRLTIVDNASDDGTRLIGMRLATELENVRFMHLAEKGRGRALRSAWMSSDARVLAYMDVDLSTSLDSLGVLVAPLLSGSSDISIGSRLAPGARVRRSAEREVISRAYNLLLRSVLHTRFRDAQCGFKAIRAQVARHLLPAVRDQGWFFDTELLVIAQRDGFRDSRNPRRVGRGPGFAREHSANRAHRPARRASHAPPGSVRSQRVASPCGPAAGGPVMPAPKRRITPAERDRALRLRRKLTASFGVIGTSGRGGARRRGVPHQRRDLGDERRLDIVGDVLHDDHHAHAVCVLVVYQHRVVAVHRIGEHRQLIFSEYCQRRLMTLAAHRGTALGTLMHVVVTVPDMLGAATHAVEEVVAAIDMACSRFRDDSELTRFQAGEGRHEGIVSPLLAQALATAIRAAELTEGAVDPTVGEAVRNAGYSVDFDALPAEGAPLHLTVSPIPGWRRLRLYPASRRLEIDAGVEVDLGATAKALAADLAAQAALEAMRGDGGVLVSLGGDVSVAGDPPEDGWNIQIAEDSRAPITPDGETIAIRSGGVATSSTTVRRWRRGGVELHHIIDPATGTARCGTLADGQRRGGHLRRRQHRRHRGDRSRCSSGLLGSITRGCRRGWSTGMGG